MGPFFWLCTWIMSLLVATYLGYDRGRWAEGMALGLLFGPLGAIAAGLLRPSVECVGQRQYELHQLLQQLRDDDRRAAGERRRNRDALNRLAEALEEGYDAEQTGFAEDLEQLAGDLEDMAGDEPSRQPKLRKWSTWLKGKASTVRSLPRYNNDEL